jgi:hypothetical protein
MISDDQMTFMKSKLISRITKSPLLQPSKRWIFTFGNGGDIFFNNASLNSDQTNGKEAPILVWILNEGIN